MPVLTCRTGLYLYSRPINQFFKRSIRLWSEWFDQWIFDSFFNVESIHTTPTLPFFFIKKNRLGSSLIISFDRVLNTYVYTFILHPFWSFDGKIPRPRQSTPFVRTASIESLHLSFFSLSEPFFVFGKQDLAQDCPFLLIPGFLWIWKLSLSRFPYQGSIQLSP